MDLGELWGARKWRKLLNLIDQLPGNTRLAEAISNDEEHVEAIIAAREHSDSSGPSGPPLSEYNPMVERLDRLIDAVGQNTAATIAAAGAKPPTIPPQPRPTTAFDTVKHRRRLAQHDALTARLLRRRSTE